MGPSPPKFIENRIMGAENECPISGINPELCPIDEFKQQFLSILFPEDLFWRKVGPAKYFISNQGRVNFESCADGLCIPEISTPESLGAEKAALQETASAMILANVVSALRSRFPHHYVKMSLHKSDRNCKLELDGNGTPTTLGCNTLKNGSSHGNYLTFADTVLKDLNKLELFIKTRWMLIGNLWLEFTREGLVKAVLSQRAGLIEVFENCTSVNVVPIIGSKGLRQGSSITRNETIRFHDPSENQNMSETQLFLKRITMDIMLAMIEDKGFLEPLPEIRDKRFMGNVHANAVKFFNGDVFGHQTVELANGEKWSALAMQRYFIDKAERYFREGRGPFTEERKQGLRLWIEVVDAIERRDLKKLARILDWAAILYYIFLPRLNRLGIDPRGLFSRGVPAFQKIETARGEETLIAHFLMHIIEYADVDTTNSTYGRLVKKGMMDKLFPIERIDAATKIPPTDTRASYREELMLWTKDRLEVDLSPFQGWEAISVHFLGEPRSVIYTHYCHDPYQTKVRGLDKKEVTAEELFPNKCFLEESPC